MKKTHTEDSDNLLDEREVTHGKFCENARITMECLALFSSTKNWESMPNGVKFGILMTIQKFGRAANGDQGHEDHYDDAVGYTRLALQESKKQNE